MLRTLLTLALAAALFSPNIAIACRCRQPPPPKQALKSSAAVFLGRVTNIERTGGQNKVTFRVSRTWKGVGEKQVIVLTNISSAACGYGFKEGESYLVYCFATAGKKPTRLQTNICTRTKTLKQAGGDLKDIGLGQKIGGSADGSE